MQSFRKKLSIELSLTYVAQERVLSGQEKRRERRANKRN